MPAGSGEPKSTTAADTSTPNELGKADNAQEQASSEEAQKPTRPLDVLQSFVGSTSRIVQQAASILEEEVAAGIVAAQRVEERYVDVKKLRSDKPDEVIQRFRHDAHEVVDILIDLVNLATNSLNSLTQRAITISGSSEQPTTGTPLRQPTTSIPALTVTRVIMPGESAEISMTLENDSDSETETFQFISSDLINAAGERLLAQQISFTPASLTIGPRHSATVTVMVTVPEGTNAGVYSGLLQATKLQQLRAVLTVQIK